MLIAKIILRATHKYTINTDPAIGAPTLLNRSPTPAAEGEFETELLNVLGQNPDNPPPEGRQYPIQDVGVLEDGTMISPLFFVNPGSLTVPGVYGSDASEHAFYAFPIAAVGAHPNAPVLSLTLFERTVHGNKLWFVRFSNQDACTLATRAHLDMLNAIIQGRSPVYKIPEGMLPRRVQRAE
jgi:hypothetical protein